MEVAYYFTFFFKNSGKYQISVKNKQVFYELKVVLDAYFYFLEYLLVQKFWQYKWEG